MKVLLSDGRRRAPSKLTCGACRVVAIGLGNEGEREDVYRPAAKRAQAIDGSRAAAVDAAGGTDEVEGGSVSVQRQAEQQLQLVAPVRRPAIVPEPPTSPPRRSRRFAAATDATFDSEKPPAGVKIVSIFTQCGW